MIVDYAVWTSLVRQEICFSNTTAVKLLLLQVKVGISPVSTILLVAYILSRKCR